MWKEMVRFEIAYQLRQSLFYISALVFFGLGVLLISTNAGVVLSHVPETVLRNAPFVVVRVLTFTALLALFVITAFVSSSALRDFEQGTHMLFFSKPLKKRDYLLGRFAGSMALSMVLMLILALGMVAGSFAPWQSAERIGPFMLSPYLFGLGVIVLPNLLMMGSLFFALAIWGRRGLFTYLGVVLFLILQDVAEEYAQDLANVFWASLLEPMGFEALGAATRYWTVSEFNSLVPALTTGLLYNRLCWLGVGFLALAGAYAGFSYTRAISRRKKWKLPSKPPAKRVAPVPGDAPRARIHPPSWRLSAQQLWRQTSIESRAMMQRTPFIILLFLGVGLTVMTATMIGGERGTPIYPITHLMLRAIELCMRIFLSIILVIYSGELVWRERSNGMAPIYDALPIGNHTLLGAKFLTLVIMAAVVLCVSVLATLGVQVFHHFTRFEFGLYARGILAILWPFVLFAALALCVQVLSKTRWIGYLVMVLVMGLGIMLPLWGLEHKLYRFSESPVLHYSDMNGYGHFVGPFLWFKTYWSFAAIGFLVIATAFWQRGLDDCYHQRFRAARDRYRGALKAAGAIALVGFIGSGGYIFYNTNILNEYVSSKTEERIQADYEKKYGQYRTQLHPRITSIYADVDIYPHQQRVDLRGTYWLTNKTAEMLDEVLLGVDPIITIRTLSVRGQDPTVADTANGHFLYALAPPLSPGDSLEVSFELAIAARGFVASNPNKIVVANGTFFNNGHLFPTVGYDSRLELKEQSKRRKHGLPARPGMAACDDLVARGNNYVCANADWVRFETVVSTAQDQIALAPGYLQREWLSDGRRYFHYKMDAPILNFYAYLSADYVVENDRWEDVDIAVYYHRPHDFNVFENNTATGLGGGVYFNDSRPQFHDCVFSGNTAPEGGGVYANLVPSNYEMTNCLFEDNTATDGGGAICFEESSALLRNFTLSDNSASSGGGIKITDNSSITVYHSIVAFNTQGGAVQCDGTSSATLHCCDVHGNVGGDWEDCIALYAPPVSSNIDLDPLFCGDDNPNDPYSLGESSPCAPGASACDRIGARGVGCVGPEPASACCVQGACNLVSEDECDAAGGTWHSDWPECDPNPCPAVCCVATQCSVSDEATCLGQGGQWYSDQISCDPNPCPAACCTGATCQLVDEGECGTLGGVWHSDWPACDPNPCPAVCCVEGECSFDSEDVCIGLGGEWHSDWTSCDPNPCALPAPSVCCVDGGCYLITEAMCTDMGGDWHNEWTTCTPSPCAGDPSDLSGGVFIAHHPPDLSFTNSPWSCQHYIDELAITSCGEQNTRIESDTGFGAIWYILAAWPNDKEWTATAFGLGDYDPASVSFVLWERCCPAGDCLEVSSSGWPGPSTGTALVAMSGNWNGNYLPVYRFAMSEVYAGDVIPLDVNPEQGMAGWYNNDPLPVFWGATCLGAMGLATDGGSCCPPSSSVCCVSGTCYLIGENQCTDMGGQWHPGTSVCDPSPCTVPIDHADHNVGDCVLTVTDQGILGFTTEPDGEGSGFRYPVEGSNHLFIGGLWVGESVDYVANRDYASDPTQEWIVSTYPDGHIWIDEQGTSSQDIHSCYTDSAAATPRGLFVNQESWAYAVPDEATGLVILHYTITNAAAVSLADLHAGVFLDLDVNDNSTNDIGMVDAGNNLVYLTDASGIYTGLVWLYDDTSAPLSNLTLVHNPTYTWPQNYYVLEEDKHEFLTAADPEHVLLDGSTPDDYSVLAATGPFDLVPEGEQLVAFAVVGGESLEELILHAQIAQIIHVGGYGEVPDTPGAKPAMGRLIPGTPNPFSKHTLVCFDLARAGAVDLSVYDLSGRQVRTLARGRYAAKRYVMTWDGRDDNGRETPSGVYF
ncbi:right-handed parallel beta-helix repeat-containing protein, partial [Candidatus Eisenbacteria bacterium]